MEEKSDPTCKGPKNEKKKRSVTWNHFNVIVVNNEDGIAEFAHCKYCHAKYKCSENGKNLGTSNLMDHLKEKHQEVKLNLRAEGASEFVFSQDKYRAALLKWIIECDQAFTAPQQTSFLELVSSLNPNAKTVSSATLKRDLKKKHSEKFEKVKSMVTDIPGKISFTTDGWTSRNIFPFVNIRAHWIDVNWEPQSVLLEFSEIHGDHSGANLCKIFMKCIGRYGISVSKVLAITLDNATNNDTLITSFRNELVKQGVDISADSIHVRCLAHIMNLSVQDILASLKCTESEVDVNVNVDENMNDETDNDSEVSDTSLNEEMTFEPDVQEKTSSSKSDKSIVAKLRKLIKKIRKSPKMREALREICTSIKLKYKVPIIDVKTRWNSSYRMIERAFELKESLNELCKKTKSLSSFLISTSEWNELNIIMELLQKFDRATKFISMDRHITISAYLPTLYWLIDSVESFIEENSGSVAVAAEKGLAKLRKYETLMSDSKIALISLFLNPALKLSYFKEHNYRKEYIKEIEKMIQKVLADNYGSTDLAEKNEKDDGFFAHMFKRSKKEENLTEFQKYVRYPLLSPKVDLLQHWKTQEIELPCLANMARDYLGAQSSSVPVERDFSGGVDLVTPKRCSLKPETIQACMCLKSWFKNKI